MQRKPDDQDGGERDFAGASGDADGPEAFGVPGLLLPAATWPFRVGCGAPCLSATFDGGSGAAACERERAGRILIWFVVSGVLWVLGALLGGTAQVVLWIAALLLDYGAPLVTFWVPGLPRLPPSAWNLEPAKAPSAFSSS